jgi:cobalt-zinc-cadmium resistance protein CzcA
MTLRIPGTSLEQSVRMQQTLENTLLRSSPRSSACSHASAPPRWRPTRCRRTPATATSCCARKASGPQAAPQPRRTGPGDRRREPARCPASPYELSQPIQLRFNELISGVRSDVAVKVFGDDPQAMEGRGASRRGAPGLGRLAGRGRGQGRADRRPAGPDLNRSTASRPARYGLNVADVQEAFGTLVGGRAVGLVFEGDRRFAITVRLPEGQRNDLDALLQQYAGLAAGAATAAPTASRCPASRPCRSSLGCEPGQPRERQALRIVVSANVRGTRPRFLRGRAPRARHRQAVGRHLAGAGRPVRTAGDGDPSAWRWWCRPRWRSCSRCCT